MRAYQIEYEYMTRAPVEPDARFKLFKLVAVPDSITLCVEYAHSLEEAIAQWKMAAQTQLNDQLANEEPPRFPRIRAVRPLVYAAQSNLLRLPEPGDLT